MADIRSKEINLVPIEDIKLNPKNRNRHPQDQIERLAKLIEFQGFRNPITVSNRSGIAIAGEGRFLAAKLIGMSHVPVIFHDFDSEEQEYAYGISDNAIADWAELDLAAINADLGDLGPDFDLDMLGMKDFKLDVSELEPQCDEDAVPEHVEPKTKLGDIYQLGRHRLMCGDSTSIDDVERLMAGSRAHICFTSPPYNAGALEIEGNESTQRKYNQFEDEQTEDEFKDFIIGNLNCILSVCDEVLYNIGLVEKNKRVIVDVLGVFRDRFKDIIYWKKSTVAPHIQPGVVNNLVEFILCFGNGKRKFEHAQFSQGTYWNVIEGPNAAGNEYSKIHKATFPVYLPENVIENFCPKGGSVLDTFGGTGTTMIASEKLGRSSFLMELDPHYCDVIVARWEKYTGKKAELVNG